MIQETIRQIEARLQSAQHLPPETRAELLGLVAKLHAEAKHLPSVESLPNELPGEAAAVKTIEADVARLRNSVEEFEDSHPKLVQTVNHLANTLAGLGI